MLKQIRTTQFLSVQMCSEQGEWQKRGREGESEMAELIWPLAIWGYSSHFLSTYFSPSHSTWPSLCLSEVVSYSYSSLSWRDWLLPKSLRFNNCDNRLTIVGELTLVLFSRSACTSFWDPPHSQYSLSQREDRYITFELVWAHTVMTAFTQTHKYTENITAEPLLPSCFRCTLPCGALTLSICISASRACWFWHKYKYFFA